MEMTDLSAPPAPEYTLETEPGTAPEPSLSSEELDEAITPTSEGSLSPPNPNLASPTDLNELQARLQEAFRRQIPLLSLSYSSSPPRTLPSLTPSPHRKKAIVPLTLEDPERDRDLIVLRTAARINGTLKLTRLDVHLSAMAQHVPFVHTMHRGSMLVLHHTSLSEEKVRELAAPITAGGGKVTQPLARWGVESLAGDQKQLVLLGEEKKNEEEDEAEERRNEKGKAVAHDKDLQEFGNRLNRFERHLSQEQV